MFLVGAQVGTEVSSRPRPVSTVSNGVTPTQMSQSFNERKASAKAIAEAIVGVPIVITQQVLQNIGDVHVGNNITVAQRLTQLRALGEMTVRLGSNALAKRMGGQRR